MLHFEKPAVQICKKIRDCTRAFSTSLLDLLPPPSPLVPYPSLSSKQGIHLLAFHPLLPWEPSSFLPHPAFVHPLSPCWCLDNIDPLVARFTTPPHSTLPPQPPSQGTVPCPTLPSQHLVWHLVARQGTCSDEPGCAR